MQSENETFDSDCDDSTNNLDTSHILSVCLKTSAKSQPELLSFHEFDFNSLVKNPFICVIGKRASGKTILSQHLLLHMYEQKKIDECIVISPTDKMNPKYNNIVDVRYHEYSEKLIEELLKIQTNRIELAKQNNTRPKNVAILLDNCLAQKGLWSKSQAMMELLFNGRHYFITIILTMQFPLGIAPEIRANFDYIFLAKDDYISNIKRMHDHYAGMFPTFDIFRQVFLQMTENFRFMTIVNRGAGRSLFDKIYWHSKSADSLTFIKIPVTNLKKYNLLKGFNSKLIESKIAIPEPDKDCEKMSEFSDTVSQIDFCDTKSVTSTEDTNSDRLEKLLLNITKCNSNILRLITLKSNNDNKIEILENIVNSNALIANFLLN